MYILLILLPINKKTNLHIHKNVIICYITNFIYELNNWLLGWNLDLINLIKVGQLFI